MLINWFTVTAQIVNFLVLVYLLKRFLYKPIVKAMDERDRRIASRLEEAEQREEAARQEQDQYEEKKREIDDQRDTLLGQIKEDVETQRKELVSKTRLQVDAVRTNWYHALEREKEAFLRELRERAGKHVCAIARRALKDLGNVELEQHMVRLFIERLRGLDQAEQKALKESVHKSKQEVAVTSAFEIPEAMSREIAEVLRAYTADSKGLQFETSPDVICGIELRAHGRKIAWSVRDYLEGLETTLAEVLIGEAKGPDQEASSGTKQKELDQEEQEKAEGPALGKE